MAKQPHDNSGMKCAMCPHIFTKEDITLTITRQIGNHHIATRVCRHCHHAYYAEGE